MRLASRRVRRVRRVWRVRRMAAVLAVAVIGASLPVTAGSAAPAAIPGMGASPGTAAGLGAGAGAGTAAGPGAAMGLDAGGGAPGERPENFDARRDGAARTVLAQRRASLAATPPDGVRELRRGLGRQGLVEIDPLTVTPRRVAKLDGYLTGPSRRAPARVALEYVRTHARAFGLTEEAVAALALRRDYVDVAGIHHLSFVQRVAGVPVFGNGLKAHVSRDGRLIQVDGSPLGRLPAAAGVPGLTDAAGEAGSGGRAEAGGPAGLTAQEAHDAAVADVGGDSQARAVRQDPEAGRLTTFTGGDQAQQVIFQTVSGARLGWQAITLAEGYLHVLDARTGRVLYRQSLTAADSALVWDNYAGAPRGGQQRRRDLTRPGWLPADSPWLSGNVAHVYTDLDDDDRAGPGEEVPPERRRRFHYPFNDFTAAVGAPCADGFRCSWDPTVPESWRANREQNATQLFYFLGAFHDHLRDRPIGFTRAAGNFEAVDGDAVQGQALDGANLAGGMPDAYHVDNANMSTPPDGFPPTLQTYLFHAPGGGGSRFLATNSADTADIVYHEYTHGLSSRLVVDAAGVSTLGTRQANAMGEGWSDWYALDYLVGRGLEADTAEPGELRMGKSVRAGVSIRTAPIDCPVAGTAGGTAGGTESGTAAACPAGGGYTYGDYGRVAGTAQPHADGEIWSQTLWDLRAALGSRLTRSLLTRAMELSPANPSYLDMRNAILQADVVVDRGRARATIWRVFAARGMGWFAASLDGDDTSPAESFALPPAPDTPGGTLTGVVTDADSGAPVAGAVVGFGGHATGFAGDYAATTEADGSYRISGIPPGTYPKTFVRAAGYDVVFRTVPVIPGGQALDWSTRRDWAAASGGSQAVQADGGALAEAGCDPTALIDQSQGTGWSAPAEYDAEGVMRPRAVTIRLPQPVDIAELSINPSATCANSASASTSRYRLETSPDGVTWTEANVGNFGLSHRNRMNVVPLGAGAASGVWFVRYTMISTQVEDVAARCPGPYSGCRFVDSVELAIYGLPAR